MRTIDLDGDRLALTAINEVGMGDDMSGHVAVTIDTGMPDLRDTPPDVVPRAIGDGTVLSLLQQEFANQAAENSVAAFASAL
nr:hypothetical protein [Micromonospora sp. DSM 115978]